MIRHNHHEADEQVSYGKGVVSMDKNTLILMALALILSITLIFTGSGSCNLHSPIYINLSISKTPLVNESADLTCNVSSIMDAPNTTAIISLPEGVELVSGELNGRWDLKANDPVHLNATIRFSKAGDFQIKAAARRAIDANNFWGDSDSIYLTIGKEASSFTLPLPWAGYPSIQESEDGVRAEAVEGRVISIDPRALPRPDELPVASRGQDSNLYDSSSAIAEQSAEKMPTKFGESLENATAPASPGALLVKGTWLYNGSDSVFRTDDGDELLPCKRMLVEVVKASNLSQVLGIGFTNSNGAFSINISNDGSAFYIFLWTYTSYGPGYELRVVDPSNTSLTGLNGVYYWHAGPFTSSDGTFNMGRAWPNPIYPRYRACWLHQDLWRADDFLYDYGLKGYQATIAWSPTINVGTYYTHGGQIRIAAGKEYASHVVIHEYGHNYMYREYGNYFPPFDCPTHWVENCYDNGCGWTEGWADFFCIAVNNDTVYKDPDFSFDFEPGDWDTPGYCDGPTCEGRVAGALWDIFDSNPDGIDLSAYSWGYDEIANVFVNANQNIFADFWNQWRGYGYSDDAAHCLWQNTIDPGINLRPNTPATPTGPGTGYTGTSYAFSTSAIDPRDGNNVRFAFDWGDGTYTTTGYVPSNTTASASHVWTSAGTKSIKANATDSNGLSSYLWSDQTTIEIVNIASVPVYRMYSPSQTDHFYTTNYDEYTTHAPAVGYIGEGILGNIYGSSQIGTIPIYRMYSPSQTDHFYTTNYDEYTIHAPAVGYIGEGILGNIYGSSQTGTIPIYRMYSPSQTDHFYTTSYYEYSTIAPTVGYIGEGILGYMIQPVGLAEGDDLPNNLVNATSMERGNGSAKLLNEEI